MRDAPYFAPSNGEQGLTPRTKALIDAAKKQNEFDKYWAAGGDYLSQWRIRK